MSSRILRLRHIWTLLTWDVSMVPLTYSISLIMLLLVSQSSMLPFASLKPPTAIRSFHCTTVREQKASVRVLRVLEFQAAELNLFFSTFLAFLILSLSDFNYVLTNENCISSTKFGLTFYFLFGWGMFIVLDIQFF